MAIAIATIPIPTIPVPVGPKGVLFVPRAAPAIGALLRAPVEARTRTAAQAALALGPPRLSAKIAVLAAATAVGVGVANGKAALAVLPSTKVLLALPRHFY